MSGVQYTHRDSVTCIKHAEERAGASLLGYLYRFEWCRSSRCLRLIAYKITKKTPKGWRIFLGPYSGTRQVIEGTRRKFAAPTIEKALESYRCRKTRYFHILQHQLEEAKEQMESATLPEAYPFNKNRDPLKTLRLFIGDEEFVA
jgi:hypothetical protein